jgi:formin 2
VIWFDIEEVDLSEDFVNLFSKPTPKPLTAKQKKQNSPAKEFSKLLDSKRSHSVGILMSSQHLDANVIRDALMDFDCKILSYETLATIYNMRPLDDEIKMLNQYVKLNGEGTLDKPEMFLLELSRIPAFAERIYCLVYQNCFNETITAINFRLNSIKTICDDLTNSDKIKKLLGS